MVDDLVVVFGELKLQNAGVFNMAMKGISIEEAVEGLRAEMLEYLT